MTASTKRYIKALLNIFIFIVSLVLVVFLVPRVLVFFAPFVVGWIIAWIANPVVRFLEEKLKIKRKASTAFVIILVIALVILCIYLVGGKVVQEVIAMVEDMPQIWSAWEKDLEEVGEAFSVVLTRLPVSVQDSISNLTAKAGELIVDLVESVSSPTIEVVGRFAKSLPALIISVVMCLLSSYFFVADKNVLADFLRQHTPNGIKSTWNMVKNSVIKSVGGYIKAQFKIEIWIYLLLVIGLLVLRVNYVLVVALGIALLDIVPFLGTGTVMVPWAIIKLFSGEYGMAIGLIVIWGISQLVRQFIQPKIMGDSMGMPALPSLFLLYIGYKMGGVLGMIISIPIGMIVLTLYQAGAFETTKNSFLILINGLNRFRKLTPQDLASIKNKNEEE
ncbi:MAG: sporulation integral membrane protein YtvI [Lachnospiraceae bacterium]|nr:sporulation integral membrane protein YtvI [Lachnospiraceae bacterium]